MTKISGNFLRSVQGRWAFCLFLLLLLLAAMLGSLCCGVLNLPAGEVLSTLWNGNPEMEYRILFQIRLPRILLAALSGASLAVSGTILQGVMRNPLASPDIIGISSGGGFAGILVMLMFPAYTHLLLPAAFSGALATAFLVYLLAWKRGASPMRLILAGVAVSSMLGALSSALLLFHADKAGNILDFTLGSFSARSWEHLKTCWIYMGTGFAGAVLLGPALNILALGDESAAALGLKVERRPIPEEELATFEEAGACGTAAVISPISHIDDPENGRKYVFTHDGTPGPVSTKLYHKLRAIQYGDEPDTHGWVTVVE